MKKKNQEKRKNKKNELTWRWLQTILAEGYGGPWTVAVEGYRGGRRKGGGHEAA